MDRYILLASAVTVLIVLSTLLMQYQYHTLDVHKTSKKNIHACIYDNPLHINYHFTTEQNIPFNVTLVKNSTISCINPHFPSIHIATSAEHNAWFHTVYTNAQDPALQEFIDADVKNKQLYPFYTFEQDFYDAPLWHYTLFSKPLSFWRGHAYALLINHDEKTIYCLGGVSWGFDLAPLSLYPDTIDPYPIDNNSWLQDRRLLKEKHGEYRILN